MDRSVGLSLSGAGRTQMLPASPVSHPRESGPLTRRVGSSKPLQVPSGEGPAADGRRECPPGTCVNRQVPGCAERLGLLVQAPRPWATRLASPRRRTTAEGLGCRGKYAR